MTDMKKGGPVMDLQRIEGFQEELENIIPGIFSKLLSSFHKKGNFSSSGKEKNKRQTIQCLWLLVEAFESQRLPFMNPEGLRLLSPEKIIKLVSNEVGIGECVAYLNRFPKEKRDRIIAQSGAEEEFRNLCEFSFREDSNILPLTVDAYRKNVESLKAWFFVVERLMESKRVAGIPMERGMKWERSKVYSILVAMTVVGDYVTQFSCDHISQVCNVMANETLATISKKMASMFGDEQFIADLVRSVGFKKAFEANFSKGTVSFAKLLKVLPIVPADRIRRDSYRTLLRKVAQEVYEKERKRFDDEGVLKRLHALSIYEICNVAESHPVICLFMDREILIRILIGDTTGNVMGKIEPLIDPSLLKEVREALDLRLDVKTVIRNILKGSKEEQMFGYGSFSRIQTERVRISHQHIKVLPEGAIKFLYRRMFCKITPADFSYFVTTWEKEVAFDPAMVPEQIQMALVVYYGVENQLLLDVAEKNPLLSFLSKIDIERMVQAIERYNSVGLASKKKKE